MTAKVAKTVPSTKGTTKTGAPRQRAYRTYYALNPHGIMIRFSTYEERERAIKEGEVTRLTAHEARERSSQGAQAVSLAAARAVSPVHKAKDESTLVREPLNGTDSFSALNIDTRDLVQAQLLAEQAQATLATIIDKLNRLGKR